MFESNKKIKIAIWYKDGINTDDIIPADFLHGGMDWDFSGHLFDKLRFTDKAELGAKVEDRVQNLDFFLNKPEYENAQVLITGDDFGCGSSREHAPKALKDYGFKVIIAPSFAKIFYENAFKNGLLLITLDKEKIEKMLSGYTCITVDLKSQSFFTDDYEEGDLSYDFEISGFKKMLLSGVDEKEYTHQNYADDISDFRQKQKENMPWA